MTIGTQAAARARLFLSIIFNASYFARACTRHEFRENTPIFGEQIFVVGFPRPAVTMRPGV